ncbi:hypothetical protein [uncultured Tenacibaculum sp.]|uniref:hypothetical protein n=1 Tax=uncultured Tenacibaculum sp. TaxID=174713 RepID=UPI00262B00C6|nr:hypothetical protein [uncultured Tenacibaculum sp.]
MKLIKLYFLVFTVCLSAQMEDFQKLGYISKDELAMKLYDKDSTAKAVVLEERGYQYVDRENNYRFRRDVYRRVKIFSKEEFDRATIAINTYKSEDVKNIKAVTYSLQGDFIRRTYVSDKNIFRKQLSETWKQTSFTLPDLKEGCVIEYTYSIISPYSQLNDWNFQSDIPKMKSDFTASILGNWKHNVRLRSSRPLDRSNSYIKNNCVHIDGVGDGDCWVIEYGLDNIPAFKGENFMLAEDNFKSKIIFESISYTAMDGKVTNYTSTWKDADKTLKNNFFDGQTSKKNYFKRNLPSNLLTIKNDFERADAVYKHIQERLNWNDKYWSRKKIKVKNIYDDKVGAVDAINLTLYNALTAANIETYLVVLSTRQNGVVTKLYPSISEFNYVIIKTVIDGETYFLDATDKQLMFGEIPYRCLNGEGRVLDFKKGSYWELIKPKFKSYKNHSINLEFKDDVFVGKIITAKKGYYAIGERKAFGSKSEDKYLEDFETRYPLIEVDEFNATPSKNGKDSFKTFYSVSIPDLELENVIRINPFIIDRNSVNPFKLKERKFPVDFGHAWSKAFNITIKIPEGYEVSQLPKTKAISLPNKGGRAILNVKTTGDQIKIYNKLFFSKAVYNEIEYHYIKKLYNEVINMQSSYIEFKKK